MIRRQFTDTSSSSSLSPYFKNSETRSQTFEIIFRKTRKDNKCKTDPDPSTTFFLKMGERRSSPHSYGGARQKGLVGVGVILLLEKIGSYRSGLSLLL